MRKILFLLSTLLFLGFISIQAQTIHVSGFVTNELNGDPVPGHDVIIMANDSSLYYGIVTTDANGFYIDSIFYGGGVINSLYLYTNDLCTFTIHDTTVQNPGQQVSADFEICVDSVPGPECQAYFYYQADSSNQNTIHFYDASTSTYAIDSWYWNFGDGTTSTEQNPVHSYNTTGTFNACLIITADSGFCSSTYCKYVYISGGGGNDCEADFYYVQDSIVDLTFLFFDQSTPVNGITSWNWDFGDGNTSSEQNPVHKYDFPGTYNVCLSIENPDSGMMCTDTYCMNVVATSGGGNDCQAYFYYLADSSNQYTIYFYDFSVPAGLISSWLWDFGDGNTSTLQNPVHSYNTTGTFNVCLTISADSGFCTSTYCKYVYITGGGNDCEADFTYVQDSVAVQFYDQSTPVNGITSWSWDFGDGNTSSDQNPVHQYDLPGTYNVCLSIENPDSGTMCTDTYCMDVTVTTGGGFNCQAYFYYTIDSNSYLSNTVYFYDFSVPAGLISSWFWDFGDGTTSALQNPVHAYDASGTYTACLTITTDSVPCTSTYCKTVLITLNNQLQLGGNVFAGIYQLDYGFAYAYKSENGEITDIYSEMIDTLGYYLFYPLVAADYYVKAEPSPNSAFFGNYMPTYYGDVVTWEDALLISLAQNVHTADINLIPMNQNILGAGQISGNIVHGSTLRDNTPAVGVQIMLANEQGEFVGLAYSDEEGKFVFESLPYGTFTLYAEVAGIGMIPEDFTLTEENAMIDNISLIMTDDEIYFGPSSIETLEDITLSDIYPNPVVNTLKMDIGINDPTTITVRIVNQLGQVMQYQQISIQQGQTLEVSTESLHSGMYFLEMITKNNYRTTRRFVKL